MMDELGEEPSDELGGSDRSRVHRVRTGDTTVIVKRFLAGGQGFAREAAALSVMPEDAPTPRLLDETADPPTVVMSDAGPGRSVADDLLGDDPAAARKSLLGWAEAVARLHNSTAGSGDAFRAALAARSDEPVATSGLERAIELLDGHCDEVGAPRGDWGEVRRMNVRLGEGSSVLSPGDLCPDNNVTTPYGLVLIDFERAQWQHPAWDLAYLAVPWPNCWCSWRLPDDVAEQALDRYRRTADRPGATADVEAASTLWAVRTAARFLPEAFDDFPQSAELRRLMPGRRAQVMHRLRRLPMLDGLRSVLAGRWGETPLPYAPAFA
ncbi:phosphotransferase [Actinoplanes bogorensis]|uniref:Phosphotransferase n=1 Tax=Paractinoplanes bogorensis TaxID=1610840 RepID=A0ABS5YPE9_9ACTN|nr:phosphotransferase [Actinoplanes bogorensis]MBU2665342.1 phosphotransferase [Actinoplanes bogorensis]